MFVGSDLNAGFQQRTNPELLFRLILSTNYDHCGSKVEISSAQYVVPTCILSNLQYQFTKLFCMLSTAHSTWQQILLVAVRPGEVAQATGIQAEKFKAVPETVGIKSHSYSLFEWHPSCLPTSSKRYQERDFTSKSTSSETPPFQQLGWLSMKRKSQNCTLSFTVN